MTLLVEPLPIGAVTPVSRLWQQGPTKYLFEGSTSPRNDQREVAVPFPQSYSLAKRDLMTVALESLNQLLRLRAGWDGMRATAVAPVAAVTAIQWLNLLADDETIPPQVFPLVNGGVQMEWLVNGESLELEVSPSGDVGVLGMDAAGNVLVEGDYPDLGSRPDFVVNARKHLGTLSRAVRSVRPRS